MSALPTVAISIGDPNGVGPEIILKSFGNKTLFEQCIPVVYADFNFIQALQNHFGTKVPLQRLDNHPKKDVLYIKSVWENSPEIDFGKQSAAAGIAAFESLQAAAKAVQQKESNALITGPIHKAAIKSHTFPFAGHTHYLLSLIHI